MTVSNSITEWQQEAAKMSKWTTQLHLRATNLWDGHDSCHAHLSFEGPLKKIEIE